MIWLLQFSGWVLVQRVIIKSWLIYRSKMVYMCMTIELLRVRTLLRLLPLLKQDVLEYVLLQVHAIWFWPDRHQLIPLILFNRLDRVKFILMRLLSLSNLSNFCGIQVLPDSRISCVSGFRLGYRLIRFTVRKLHQLWISFTCLLYICIQFILILSSLSIS